MPRDLCTCCCASRSWPSRLSHLTFHLRRTASPASGHGLRRGPLWSRFLPRRCQLAPRPMAHLPSCTTPRAVTSSAGAFGLLHLPYHPLRFASTLVAAANLFRKLATRLFSSSASDWQLFSGRTPTHITTSFAIFMAHTARRPSHPRHAEPVRRFVPLSFWCSGPSTVCCT